MKILITNNHLNLFNGTETWCLAMKEELERQHHEVDLYTFEPSVYSKRLEELKSEYDLILVNHRTCEDAISNIKGFKIFTRHAASDDIILEQPLKLCDSYVCVSREISDKVGYKVIENGINLNRFSLSSENKYVLSLCKGNVANNKIKQASLNLSLPFIHISNVKNIEDYIKNAGMVFSYGRGCLESLACGKTVFVYDSRDYQNELSDGIITNNNIYQLSYSNFSGRWFRNIPSIRDIEIAINDNWGRYNLREYIINNYNIIDKVNQYLKIYEDTHSVSDSQC